MNKIIKKFKKHWIAIWLVVAAVSLTVITSYAIYTRVTVAKRVVSTQAGTGSLFTSDHMSENITKTTVPRTDTTIDATVEVYVYNYIYPKEAVYRSDETKYDVTATIGTLGENDSFQELSDKSELAGLNYSVSYKTETYAFSTTNETHHTFTACSIAGDKANKDLFTLVFDKSELGSAAKNYCIKLEADPYDNELPKLTGYIRVRYSKPASTGWKGEVEDLDSSKINNYDGFNYYLEGNGKGKITFKWKRSKVTINKDFLNNTNNKFEGFVDTAPVESALTETDGYVSLTLNVDSSKQNRYEIQFFKVDPSNISYTKSDVESYLPTTTSWTPDT